MVTAALPALVRFHAASGLRVALRGPLPAAVILTVAIGMQDYPGAVIAAAARSLVGREASSFAALIVVAAALGVASWARPRLGPAVSGWARHLPADARDHRRALTAALVVAQAPLAALLAGLVLVQVSQGPLDLVRAAGLPIILLGAAQAVTPAAPAPLRALMSFGACACGAWGSGLLLALGVGLIVVFDRVASDPGRHPAPAGRFSRSGTAHPARLAWRALGIDLAGPVLVALLALGAGAVLMANNPLEPSGVGRVVRLTTVLAAAWSIGTLAASLARAIPPWGWLRSLPQSSAQRVTADAFILGLPALTACLVSARWDPLAAAAAAACVPALALRGAGWMRPGAEGRHAVEWRPAVEGSVLAGLVCLLPWVAVIVLAASPALRGWAARREAACKVSA